jgi:ArsR family transcriptional regulator, arsenate/arsenite/antimonite-responsive transcriptional repressor
VSLDALPSPTANTTPRCAPLVRQALTAGEAADLSRVLKAIADPARLRLLSLIAAHERGKACVCDLTAPLGLSQPTVSHHLKVLVDVGLLQRDKRGVWSYYALVPGALDALAGVLRTVGTAAGPDDGLPSAC